MADAAPRSLEAPSTAVGAVPWPQRYAQLLDAHSRLQQALAAQEAATRRARTAVRYDPALPNNDKFTRELLEQNRALTRRCRALELRHAKLDTVLASSASLSPRRSATPKRDKPARRVQDASVQTTPVRDNNNDNSDDDDDANARDGSGGVPAQHDGAASVAPEHVQTLVAALKQRLEELDVDVVRLQRENELLRAEGDASTSTSTRMSPTEDQLRSLAQQQELEHLLSDRVRQMKILEEQFVHLQHKSKTTTMLYKESVARVEQLTSELFDAQLALRTQAERLDAQRDAAAQLQTVEKELHVLRSENATLNETVATLTARPLDALHGQLEKKALQISLLDDKNAALERELELARQDHRVAMQTNEKLRARVESLTKALETPLAELHTLKAEREQLVGEREIAQLQLQFYLSGDSIECNELMTAVGRALKLMRAAQNGPSRTGGSSPPVNSSASHEVSALQRERADKMAQVTKLLQEETRAQLQDMKIAHEAHVRDLKRQCARWQQRANEYLREITTLRRDVRAGGKPPARLEHSSAQPESSIMSGLSSRPSKEPLVAEENLLEVRLYDLRFEGGAERSSFAVFCDYFDFESQHSPVFTMDADRREAVAPVELEVSYKLLVDQAFCRSPVAQSFSVELHRLSMGTSTVVGAADVALPALFLSDQGYVAMSVKLLAPTTRASVVTPRA